MLCDMSRKKFTDPQQKIEIVDKKIFCAKAKTFFDCGRNLNCKIC